MPTLPGCLRRHGVARLADLLPEAEDQPPLPKTFKDYEPGFVHVDVKYLPRMPDEAEHRYLIAAIDRASRWVYFEIQPDKSAATAAGFLERLRAKAPFRIRTVLTDNGKSSPTAFAPPASANRRASIASIACVPNTASSIA
ncbi:MAG: DDE-type integrase/transposase/recombinase [Gammaproteobacteria bacterium]|nr:DDE-type integrase/transposase/recombinase [Gammaproteobacteria bacterium]